MTPRRLLGIAASLRNARHGAGNRGLVDDLRALETKDALFTYLAGQSRMIVEQFTEAGRREGKDFLELYRNYKRLGGDAGLSNSETALAAALWAAHREGAEIEHLSLSEHFTADGRQRDPDGLRAKLLAADGLLVSGPVYFGDRGSLAESLIGFIAGDLRLREALRGRLYGGIAVGAKRNGGQETTLIYQMLDMVNLGLLTVGNDSESTAQYGGTGYAGDVGTMHKDAEGLETSMGTGRRMAWVMKYFGASAALRAGPRVLFLVLQDAGGMASQAVKHLTTRFAGAMQASVVDVTGRRIERCVACDICPTTVGFDEEYRCVVTAKADSMGALHSALLHHDLIVPVVTSFQDPSLASKYQLFVERTRYIRRADYTWSDAMVAPLVLEEPGDYRSLPIRMMTSFLRHHTVMSKPMMGYVRDGEIDNLPRVEVDFSRTLAQATRLAAGRMALAGESPLATHYRPVGYVISTAKDVEDDRLERRKDPAEARREHLIADAQERLVESAPAAEPARAVQPEPEQVWNAGLTSRAHH
jgi:multimeric flavodoxin WrbA